MFTVDVSTSLGNIDVKTTQNKGFKQLGKTRERGHYTSLAYKFESDEQLNDWILKFYVHRLAYFAKNMGEETMYGIKITPRLLRNTRKRYLTLLMRKHNVTNGQLPTINR